MLTASRTDSGPRDSRARSDSPSTNGMMKYGSPSAVTGAQHRHDVRMLQARRRA